MIYFARCLYLCAIVLLMGSSSLRAYEFYSVQQIDKAKAKAHEKHLPIAWISSQLVYLNPGFDHEPQGSESELTRMALRTLQDQAVIIFQNADDDLPHMPAHVIDRIEVKDEGNDPPNGDHYTAPKILYADPDLTTFFGCTLRPDLKTDREAAINIALLHIQNNPEAQALIKGTAKPAAVSKPDPSAINQPVAKSLATTSMASEFMTYLIAIAGAIVLLIGIVGYIAWRGRPAANSTRPL